MKRSIACLSGALLVAPVVAFANPEPHAKVEVLPGWRMADGTHMAALRIALAEGWKTYWRAPGEAGIPPVIDWSGSENLAGVTLHWPVPEIIAANGMTTLGFTHELVLPVAVTAEDAGADIALAADLIFGICEEVCMPLRAEVAGVLPAGAAQKDARIAAALAARPDTADEAAVVSASCALAPIADGLRLSVEIELPVVGPEEHLVVEPADRAIWVSEPMVRRDGALLIAETDLVPPSAQPFEIDPETLRLTVLSPGRGVDIHGCAPRR